MFNKVGMILVPVEGTDEETLMEAALEAGATDIKQEGEFFEVYTEVGDVAEVKDALEAAGIKVESAEVTAVPQSVVKLDGKEAQKLLKLLTTLEDHDDVQKVYSNMDIPDEVLAEIG